MTFEDYIKSDTIPENLALVFHASYERSNDDDIAINNRMVTARSWYDYFTDGTISDNMF
jgi:hypothetical protein